MSEEDSMGNAPKKEPELDAPEPTSVAPDTEHAAPLTPVPPTASIPSTDSIDVDLQSSSDRKTETGPNPTLVSREQATASLRPDSLPTSERGHFGPDSGRATAAQIAKPRSKDGTHTTMQSVMRPELATTGAPHSRRFLSIEREIEQSTAAIKFLKKEQIRLQKGLRLAWIVAGLALLVALGSTYW
jgi:hypothetical protein